MGVRGFPGCGCVLRALGHLRSELELAITVAGTGGARVLLATQPYNRRGEQLDGSLYPEDEPQGVTDWNRLLRDVASRHPNVTVVDLGDRVSPEGRFAWTVGGTQVRSDGLHLTPSGVQEWIAPGCCRSWSTPYQSGGGNAMTSRLHTALTGIVASACLWLASCDTAGSEDTGPTDDPASTSSATTTEPSQTRPVKPLPVARPEAPSRRGPEPLQRKDDG
jgi:hypothetical protein